MLLINIRLSALLIGVLASTLVFSNPLLAKTPWYEGTAVEDVALGVIEKYSPTKIGPDCTKGHGPLTRDEVLELLGGAKIKAFMSPRNAEMVVSKGMVGADGDVCLHPIKCNPLFLCSAGGDDFGSPQAFGKAAEIRVVQAPEAPKVIDRSITDFVSNNDTHTVRDPETGCMVRFPADDSWLADVNRISWSGGCLNGLASGSGTLEIFKSGKGLVWVYFSSANSGLTVEDGRFRYNIDLSKFTFEVTSCESSSGYRRVTTTYQDKSLEAHFISGWVTRRILQEAGNVADQKCHIDRRKFSNIAVSVKGAWENSKPIVSARNYSPDEFTWREFKNAISIRHASMVESINETYRRAAYEKRKAAEQEAEEKLQAKLAEAARAEIAMVQRAVEKFWGDGTTSLSILAAAVQLDELNTLARLEEGVTLHLPVSDGVATYELDGQRVYRIEYNSLSPLIEIRQKYATQKGISWNDFAGQLQERSLKRITVFCNFTKVSHVPRETKPIEATLVDFQAIGDRPEISLMCR